MAAMIAELVCVVSLWGQVERRLYTPT